MFDLKWRAQIEQAGMSRRCHPNITLRCRLIGRYGPGVVVWRSVGARGDSGPTDIGLIRIVAGVVVNVDRSHTVRYPPFNIEAAVRHHPLVAGGLQNANWWIIGLAVKLVSADINQHAAVLVTVEDAAVLINVKHLLGVW